MSVFRLRLEPWIMCHENEEEVMTGPGVSSCGSTCRHDTFASSIRAKESGSRHLHSMLQHQRLRWLHVQLLLFLLAGQASCNENSTTVFPLSSTTNVQTSAPPAASTVAHYFIDVTVDVTGEERNISDVQAWLIQVFQNNLQSCVSRDYGETTASPTSPRTTPVTTYESSHVTTDTSPHYNTTEAMNSTTLLTNSTTAATSTLLTNSTTAAASTTTLERLGTTTSIPPITSSNLTVTQDVQGSENHTSGNETTGGLFQGMELTCETETGIRNTSCFMLLQLNQSIPPCCILQTLCAASKNSSDIHVVGNRTSRISQLQTECHPLGDNSTWCTYSGPSGATCEESWSAYVSDQSNSSQCSGDNRNNSHCCSAYCNGTDAYYTLQISRKDSNVNISYLQSLIHTIKEASNCTSNTTDAPCSLSTVASEYKESNVICESGATNCTVILKFANEVPICNLSAAMLNLFQSEEQISYNGQVTRAAICGNLTISNNPSQFSLMEMNQPPDTFCPVVAQTNILTCQKRKTVVVMLEERCSPGQPATPGPDVTVPQQNTTISVTPNNTLSTTTHTPTNTTSAADVTTPILNTTVDALTSNTTISTATTNPTTSNESVPVTTTGSPTTAQSDERQANALLELTKNVSNLNSSQVEQLVSQLVDLLSGPTVSLALGNTSVHIVSNLLDAPPDILSSSSNRIIGIIDTVALKLVLSDTAETLLAPAVALSVKAADGTNFQETVFSISDPNNVQVRGDPRNRRSTRSDSTVPQGSIRLPTSLTQHLTSEEQQQVSRVQFNFYQKSTVFQDKSLGDRTLNSGILSASVANLSLTGLQDNVVIHLRNTQPIAGNFVATCVFWDFTLNDGSGGWNSSGCFAQNRTENETVCSCNHLTSFAILLDLSREPLTNRVQATILTFITYIGCGVSAIFLSVTLLTYLAFGKLRKDIPSKILIQLCLALLLLNLVFLVDAWLALYPEAVGLCISTAWFLHYFLLVSFTWMGLEAVHMYLALVKVFNSYISRYMLKFSLVGWGIPMIVVIIVIAIDKNNYGLVSYGRFDDGTSDDFCWLKNDIAFYVAVVAYFCVIFLFNLVMFVVVLVQLCRIKRQNPHNVVNRTTMQDVRSVAGITILLGLTWGFAFFAWGPVNLAFMYLFAIFNSFQGFFIFLFHCAVKENVRRQWRTYLCCGKMRLAENSEWSRTATQKTAKKSTVSRQTPLHSSTSNNSSSSFLASDSSDQINGIGSPFEDTTITAQEDHTSDVVLNEINRRYRNQQAP